MTRNDYFDLCPLLMTSSDQTERKLLKISSKEHSRLRWHTVSKYARRLSDKLLVLFTELKILFLLGHLTKRYDQSQSTQEERNVGGESLTSLAVS